MIIFGIFTALYSDRQNVFWTDMMNGSTSLQLKTTESVCRSKRFDIALDLLIEYFLDEHLENILLESEKGTQGSPMQKSIPNHKTGSEATDENPSDATVSSIQTPEVFEEGHQDRFDEDADHAPS